MKVKQLYSKLASTIKKSNISIRLKTANDEKCQKKTQFMTDNRKVDKFFIDINCFDTK
jgi:hypothetical protein